MTFFGTIAPMRWPLAILLALLSCAQDPPPPGELIGTFDFVATLRPSGACALEEISELPDPIRFTGVLSHEQETGKIWLRSGGSEREGTLDGNHFTFQVPVAPPGIPREFASCTLSRRVPCPLAFTEILEGRILAECQDEEDRWPPLAPQIACPEEQEDGTLRWHDCTCIEGTFVEEVTFDPRADEICTCVGPQGTSELEGDCRLVYELIGVKT